MLAATWCVSLLAKQGSAPADTSTASIVAANTEARTDGVAFDEPAGAHQCCDSIANPDASTVSPLPTSLKGAIRWRAPLATEATVAGLVLVMAGPRRNRGQRQVWRH
jgi:hypothetical protein